MLVRFWGTRGSSPVSLTTVDLRARITAALTAYRGAGCPPDLTAFVQQLPPEVTSTFGGHTCCVQVDLGNGEVVVFDAGTGLRRLGETLIPSAAPPKVYHIVLSHFHWDHIQGLPFFRPAYVPGMEVHFYSTQPELEAVLRSQQSRPAFPVGLDYMRAKLHFHHLQLDVPTTIAGAELTAGPGVHPDPVALLTLRHQGRTLIYASDCEYHDPSPAGLAPFVERYRDADALIFDAMFTGEEVLTSKRHWGHSSYNIGIDLARAANVKRLCLFHHDPAMTDLALKERAVIAQAYLDGLTTPGGACELVWTYDGLELVL